ncbi:MAG: hypothetical protein ACREQA_19685 [Candidatus Binatia bacterium]
MSSNEQQHLGIVFTHCIRGIRVDEGGRFIANLLLRYHFHKTSGFAVMPGKSLGLMDLWLTEESYRRVKLQLGIVGE